MKEKTVYTYIKIKEMIDFKIQITIKIHIKGQIHLD